ncbi:DNA polymerase III subunit gamma/tau [Flavobacterium psychrotolerans]|nr:DNA polymerase III subunit gamma/tau [Flavobacterium psychrotolerans]
MAVTSPEIVDIPALALLKNTVDYVAEQEVAITPIAPVSTSTETKVSALSLASIRAKRELQESNKTFVKETVHLPTEPFNETDMLLHWNKYAQKLGDKGFKIMESLLSINDPTLNGTAITLELPNEGSKIDFETEMNGLLGHLKGHLHNHDITIKVIVNETLVIRKSNNPTDVYNRLYEINPNIELLKTTFGLEF